MPENVQISLGVKAETKQAQKDVTGLNKALKDLQTAAEGIGKGNNIANYGKQIKDAANAIAHINGRNNISKALEAFNETPSIANLVKFAKAVESEYDRTAKEVASSSTKTKRSLSDIVGAFKAADFPLKNFAKSLARIAKLRLLRGIIRAVTQAFKEGTTNIYMYSMAMGSLDASNFKGNLDDLATSFLYLKNSIASVAAPLLASLIPTLQTVIGWVTAALDVLAQFFAVLNGQGTYTRAKKVQTDAASQWSSIANATKGASAAAKEYENTVLGFDELNVLNDPSSGGGGGGGGDSVPDYSNMFEEVEIGQSKIRDFAEWLRNNWEDIKEIVEAIGISLLTWKIANGVRDFFKGLEKLGFNTTKAQGLMQVLAGLVITVTGVTLSFKAGYDIGYEGVNLMDVIKGAIGVALAGAGGALVAHGLTTMGVASIGTGVGAAVGIGIALVATIVGFELGFRAQLIDNAKASLEEYAGQVDEILNRQNGYVAVAQQAWENYDSTILNLGYAKKLTDDLGLLADKESLSNDEVDRAKFLIEELNGLGLEGISAAWNDETQKIEINTEKIYDNIAALEERARTAALEEILTQAYKDQIQAEIDLEKANRDVAKAQADQRKRAKELGVDYDTLTQNAYFATWATEDETSALAIANKELENATSNYENANDVIALYEDVLYGGKTATDETLKSVSFATDKQKAYTKEIDESTSKIQTFRDNADKTKKVVGDVTDSTNVGKDAWGKYADSVYNAQKINYDGSNVTGGLSNASWWADNAKEKISGVKKAVEDLSKISYSGVNIGVSTSVSRQTMAHGGFVNGYANGGYIPSYATGGINSADLFIANENNNPELVGRIGSRTAVANQGQMVEALAIGLERAFSDMSGGSSNVEVVVNMDSVAVARAADRGNKSLNRRFNVQLA